MIKGKIKKVIFHNESNGYLVALFRIRETDDENLQDKVNKTITITGLFTDLKLEINMNLEGELKNNERFGMQYVVSSYEVEKPTGENAVIEFLASSFIESCGLRTAKKIVETLGESVLDKIKESKDNLMLVEGMTDKKATKIYNSLINYHKADDFIVKLQSYGFSIDECSRIYNRFKNDIDGILNDKFYDMKELVDFNRLDNIYLNNFGHTDTRCLACIIEAMEMLSNNTGDTYYYIDEILSYLSSNYKISLTSDELNDKIDYLSEQQLVTKLDKRYYLTKYYEAEKKVAHALKITDSFTIKTFNKLDERISSLEKELNITYNDDQKKAIMSALNNNISIISGGPGTGKTTIINAIVKLYIEEHKLAPMQILENIALLAPTGRAAKKLSSSTNLPAYTIHRYLKWYKDQDDFFYNEYNKTLHHLIIVDETSMIDINLFNALLKGISPHVKLILVGDIFQLPSVGAGLVLSDLISSDLFNYVPLNIIYRQSNNSYIPYLAKEIKNRDLSEDFLNKRDDYAFFMSENTQIKSYIEQIIRISQEKGITEHQMQILAPMYKGENGIDNLNIALQEIYNPAKRSKNELKYGDITYREGDKVLQLVNDLDKNVFNGDIGYILSVYPKIKIDFEGNIAEYEKKDLHQIKHAYAITIHKSQGSEFEHVIMPISRSYYKMLYNQLVYTGVSRAKKSLTIVGDPKAFMQAINNNYSTERKTSLKEKLLEEFTEVV